LSETLVVGASERVETVGRDNPVSDVDGQLMVMTMIALNFPETPDRARPRTGATTGA